MRDSSSAFQIHFNRFTIYILKCYKIFCAGCSLVKKSKRNRVIYPICRYAYFYGAIRERQLRDFSSDKKEINLTTVRSIPIEIGARYRAKRRKQSGAKQEEQGRNDHFE